MSQIILDFSGGNTCQNDKAIVKRMIDELKAVDTGKHEVIIKFQLFINDGINIPLEHDVFDYGYRYGNEQGYKVTSSVADLESLKFLLQYDIPFVKIPNDRKLDWLIDYIPRGMKIYISVGENEIKNYGTQRDTCFELNCLKDYGIVDKNVLFLSCISKYPATKEDYGYNKNDYWPGQWNFYLCNDGVSDHTTNWDLFNLAKRHYSYIEQYLNKPEGTGENWINNRIWEVHFKLESSIGLDAGPFARTPLQLAEIL